jgi:putative oxidoreductase
MTDLAIFLLRLGLGFMFMAHGMQKAFAFFGGPGINGFSQMLSGMGFNPAVLWAYIAAYTELLGGLFIMAGFLTRISSVFLFILIVVATLKVHLAKGFFLSNGGFEYNLIILSVLVSLIIMGPGKISLNRNL